MTLVSTGNSAYSWEICTPPDRSSRLPKRTKVAVSLWRAYFIYTELKLRAGTHTGQTIDSFKTRTPDFVIELDGCPKGIEFRLFRKHDTSEDLVEEWGAKAQFNLGNNPQYQNAMEIAAATCELVRAVHIWGLVRAASQSTSGATVQLLWHGWQTTCRVSTPTGPEVRR